MAETLTVPDGDTESGSMVGILNTYKSLMVFAPANMVGTATLKVAPLDSTTYYSLQSGGEDVTVTAGDATPITDCAFNALKIVKAAALAAGTDEVFKVEGVRAG